MNKSRDMSRIHASIIETAVRLFGDSGFHQTAISELAAQAGVSVGSIYRLYRDKDDLIVAIVRSDLERRLQAIQSVVANVRGGKITVEDGIYQFVQNALAYKRETISLDILAESARNSSVGDEVKQFYSLLRGFARELAYSGNPDLKDQRLDDAQETVLAIAFRPGWPGLPRTQTQEDNDTVQKIRIITKMLQVF